MRPVRVVATRPEKGCHHIVPFGHQSLVQALGALPRHPVPQVVRSEGFLLTIQAQLHLESRDDVVEVQAAPSKGAAGVAPSAQP